jgi:hypothetical protein
MNPARWHPTGVNGIAGAVSGKIISDSPVLFGCRAPDDGALYFGLSAVDGGFAIAGIPAACLQGELLLQYYPDSMKVELPTRETLKTFAIQDPPGSLGVASKAKAPSQARFLDRPWFREFSLLGRWRARWYRLRVILFMFPLHLPKTRMTLFPMALARPRGLPSLIYRVR